MRIQQQNKTTTKKNQKKKIAHVMREQSGLHNFLLSKILSGFLGKERCCCCRCYPSSAFCFLVRFCALNLFFPFLSLCFLSLPLLSNSFPILFVPWPSHACPRVNLRDFRNCSLANTYVNCKHIIAFIVVANKSFPPLSSKLSLFFRI